mmetsp:Transcript_1221/g.3712  ORF Transcript_1221/g.3712 Transcript_1221/m.3712 type:complete len:212 (+) Transcript_1221:363-998(+)
MPASQRVSRAQTRSGMPRLAQLCNPLHFTGWMASNPGSARQEPWVPQVAGPCKAGHVALCPAGSGRQRRPFAALAAVSAAQRASHRRLARGAGPCSPPPRCAWRPGRCSRLGGLAPPARPGPGASGWCSRLPRRGGSRRARRARRRGSPRCSRCSAWPPSPRSAGSPAARRMPGRSRRAPRRSTAPCPAPALPRAPRTSGPTSWPPARAGP